MLVVLKRDFFTGEHRFKRSTPQKPTEMPDKYRSVLPKTAVIIEAPVEAAQEAAPVDLLRDLDMVRAAGKAEDEAVAKAEKFQRDLKAEQAKKGKA